MNMYTYVTFGQTHVHEIGNQIFDWKCVAIVEGGKEKVFELFEDRFTGVYDEDVWYKTPIHYSYFPKGYVHVLPKDWKRGEALVVYSTNIDMRMYVFKNTEGKFIEEKMWFVKKPSVPEFSGGEFDCLELEEGEIKGFKKWNDLNKFLNWWYNEETAQ